MYLTTPVKNPSVPLPRPSPGPYDVQALSSERSWFNSKSLSNYLQALANDIGGNPDPKENPKKSLKVNEDRKIQVAFLNGTAVQQDKVKKYAEEWLKAAAPLSFVWVKGIHGDIRVAFDDDTVTDMSWSYIGTDNTKSTPLPETMHLSEIDPIVPITNPDDPKSSHEIIIIEHCFGHALGLKFAPNLPDEAWRRSVQRKVRDTLNLAPGPPNQNWPYDSAVDISDACIDRNLYEDSVMAFGWKNKITKHDLEMIAKLYPIRVTAVYFGVQNAFDRSIPAKQDDLVIYVASKANRLYSNTRKAKIPANESSWGGWRRIADDIPPKPTGIVVLELSDRVEVFVASGKILYHKSWSREDKPPSNWDHVNNVEVTDDEQNLKAVEVEGGFEVFFIAKAGGGTVLGSIFRKPGDPTLPKNWHPVTGGSDIKCITSARIGAPTITNPPRIVATTPKSKVLISEANKKTLNWTLNDEGLFGDFPGIIRMETGMAIDTQHIFVIDKDRKLHHNMNHDGWVTWDDVFEGANPPANQKIVNIAVGVIASNDKYDGYLSVFAVTEDEDLYYNMIDYEGTWKWKSWRANINPNSKTREWPAWNNPKVPKKVSKVTAKRTRSGDLEVFAIVREDVQSEACLVLYRICFNKDTDLGEDTDPNKKDIFEWQPYVFW